MHGPLPVRELFRGKLRTCILHAVYNCGRAACCTVRKVHRYKNDKYRCGKRDCYGVAQTSIDCIYHYSSRRRPGYGTERAAGRVCECEVRRHGVDAVACGEVHCCAPQRIAEKPHYRGELVWVAICRLRVVHRGKQETRLC